MATSARSASAWRCALLALLLCAALQRSCAQTAAAQPTPLLPLFSGSVDAALALALSANQSAAYVSTFYGSVYAVPLPISSTSVLPAALYSQTSAVFQGIVVNPAQTVLYLLDVRAATLSSVSLLAGRAVTVLCTFTQEPVNGLSGLAVDFTPAVPVAYVVSQYSSAVYACAVSAVGQRQAAGAAIYTDSQGAVYSGVTVAPPRSAGLPSTLYLSSAVVAQGVPNVVLATLPVLGNTTTATATTPLVSSQTWYWPGAVTVNSAQTVAYVMDGGYDKGYQTLVPPYEVGLVYAVNISTGAAAATTVYQNTSLFLRGGLQLTQDQSTLAFLASTSLQQLVLYPQLVSKPLTQPPTTAASSSSSSSSTGAARAVSSSSAAATGGGGGGGAVAPVINAGPPASLLTLFTGSASTVDAALALALSANQSAAYVSTFYGSVYAVPLPISSTSVLPAALYSQTSAVFQGIVVNPAQTVLYLLDVRAATLSSVSLLAGRAVTVLCTFTQEPVNGLSGLAVDFTPAVPVAYVVSQYSSAVYACAVSAVGQRQAAGAAIYTDSQGAVYSGVTVAPPRSAGLPSTLYLSSAVVAQGVPNVVLATLPVLGNTTTATATTPLVSSQTWYWPGAVTVNSAQTVAYVMDGGYDKGYQTLVPPYEVGLVYAVNISTGAAAATTVYQNTSLFLRGGLQLTQDQSTLAFLASTSLQQLVLYPQLVSKPLTQPPTTAASSSSSSSSSAAAPAASSSPGSSSAAPSAATSTLASSTASAARSSSAASSSTSAPAATSAATAAAAASSSARSSSSSSAVQTSAPTSTPTPASPSSAATSPATSAAAVTPSSTAAATSAPIGQSAAASSTPAPSSSSTAAFAVPGGGSSSSGLSGGAIAGIVVGAVAFATLCCLLILCVLLPRRRKDGGGSTDKKMSPRKGAVLEGMQAESSRHETTTNGGRGQVTSNGHADETEDETKGEDASSESVVRQVEPQEVEMATM